MNAESNLAMHGPANGMILYAVPVRLNTVEAPKNVTEQPSDPKTAKRQKQQHIIAQHQHEQFTQELISDLLSAVMRCSTDHYYCFVLLIMIQNLIPSTVQGIRHPCSQSPSLVQCRFVLVMSRSMLLPD